MHVKRVYNWHFSITNQHKCSQTTTGVTYWRHFTPQISKYFARWRTIY